MIQYVEKGCFCFAKRPFLEDLAKVNTKTLKSWTLKLSNFHCVKSVQIRSNFWSVFSRIRTEYGEIPTYSVRMQENTDRKLLRIGTLHAVFIVVSQRNSQDLLGIWSYMIWKFQNFRYKIFLTRKNLKYFQPVSTCSRSMFRVSPFDPSPFTPPPENIKTDVARWD